VRTLLPGFLLLAAACGGNKTPAKAQGRPEDVAKAVFEALKVGGLGPLEPHLISADERKAVTGVVLDDSETRGRWDQLMAQHHGQLNVDWASAVPGTPKVQYDAMGEGAVVILPIRSARGTVTVRVDVTKIGDRYVFDEMKPGSGSEEKQAAPKGDGEEDDGCGCGG